jgi:hypothetical protein
MNKLDRESDGLRGHRWLVTNTPREEQGTTMTTTLIPHDEALQEPARGLPGDGTDLMVLLSGWLNVPEIEERARRYDRLVDSMYEWFEASGSTSSDPHLERVIRHAEAVQSHLYGSRKVPLH